MRILHPHIVLTIPVALACVEHGALALPPNEAQVDAAVGRLVQNLKTAQITTPGKDYGSFKGEMGGMHAGGVSALATYALLSAGVPWHDDTIQRAVKYLAEHPLPGTYSRALRAGAWANLATRVTDPSLRQRYRHLLQKDTDWLARAIKPDGYYGYDRDGTGGDHSCSQFAVLGLWTAQSAHAEVSSRQWEKIATHWLDHQNRDGSWSYAGASPGTITMTTAGVNTIYILLAEYFSRSEAPYARLRGVSSRGRLAAQIDDALEAADRGLAWLSERDIMSGGRPPGYQLFGLERLGVASGLKYIGTTDWYRAGVSRITPGSTGTINDAFRLLFLTYGRAPVLISKLRYGSGHDWDYYYRDLHFLTGYLSERHERIYKWQIVSADSPLHDLLDAPMLLIAGSEPVHLTSDQKQRLRDYVDAGGTIIGHANLASDRFARAFAETFEDVFRDRGWEFATLRPNHPLFSALPNDHVADWATQLHIRGISDGLRTCVYLFPVDLAGAWHQNLTKRHGDLFELMGNMRVYAAPDYPRLPRRLRPPELSGEPAPVRGYLLVQRRTVGTRPLNTTGKWNALAASLQHDLGLAIVTAPPAPANTATPAPADTATSARPNQPTGTDRDNAKPRDTKPPETKPPGPTGRHAPVDLIHLTGTTAFELPAKQVDALSDHLRSGGMVWIESAGSHPAFTKSARALLDTLATETGGRLRPLKPTDPILSGDVPGGQFPGTFRPNPWGRKTLPSPTPRIDILDLAGRPAVILTPFDMLATGTGHFLFKTQAYAPAPTRALLRNLILRRYDRVSGDPRTVDIRTVIRKRAPDDLLQAATAWLGAGDLRSCAAALRVLRQIDPPPRSLAPILDAFRRKITDAIRQADLAQDTQRAASLRALLAGVIPETAASAPRDPDAPAETGARPARPSDTPSNPASGAAAPERPARPALPAGLASVYVKIDDQTTDARILLKRWFNLNDELAALRDDLRSLNQQRNELIEQTKALIKAQRRRDGGKPPQRGGPEFERIAAQRRAVETRMNEARVRMDTISGDMDHLTAALKPHADALNSLGLRLERGRWIIQPPNDDTTPSGTTP